jgi:hypothetical protein
MLVQILPDLYRLDVAEGRVQVEFYTSQIWVFMRSTT